VTLDEATREWVVGQLEREAGCTREQAEKAADGGVDYREVAALVAAGCPLETALRIVAPLEVAAKAEGESLVERVAEYTTEEVKA
jgi:hypothetical protein